MGGNFVKLFSQLWTSIWMRRRSIAVTSGSAAVLDWLNLDFIRQEAFKAAPGSDKEALEEVARLIFRLLNMSGEEVMWPRQRDGTPVAPNYITIDTNKGRAWVHSKYFSRKSAMGQGRRGSARGFRAGQRSIATISQAQGR